MVTREFVNSLKEGDSWEFLHSNPFGPTLIYTANVLKVTDKIVSIQLGGGGVTALIKAGMGATVDLPEKATEYALESARVALKTYRLRSYLSNSKAWTNVPLETMEAVFKAIGGKFNE